jgi:hypothetical protein
MPPLRVMFEVGTTVLELPLTPDPAEPVGLVVVPPPPAVGLEVPPGEGLPGAGLWAAAGVGLGAAAIGVGVGGGAGGVVAGGLGGGGGGGVVPPSSDAMVAKPALRVTLSCWTRPQ